MCWSGEASIALSAVGIAGTVYAAYRKEPVALWICLGYFTLMEVLQAYTYTVIGQCSDPFKSDIHPAWLPPRYVPAIFY